VDLIPLTYTDNAAYLARLQPDLVLLHLTPPVNGLCSFGISADFGPIVAASTRKRIWVINRFMPRPRLGSALSVEALDATLEIDEPIRTFTEASPTPEVEALAAHVARLVPNGVAVQTGIGAAPAAVWKALQRHEGIILRSGMVTDGFLRAYQAGGMAERGHVAGIALGGKPLLNPARRPGSADPHRRVRHPRRGCPERHRHVHSHQFRT
jgi:acyl-CoA hydrolase